MLRYRHINKVDKLFKDWNIIMKNISIYIARRNKKKFEFLFAEYVEIVICLEERDYLLHVIFLGGNC